MRRIPITLAATAAAAAVAAAITIPAVAQNGGGGRQDPAVAKLTACLTAHGATVPSGLDGVAFKQWLGAHQDDSTLAAALKACGAGPDNGVPPGGRDIARLYSCLKSHGVAVENSPVAIKEKLGELSRSDAGKATLAACGIQIADKPAPGSCGSGKPAQPGDSPAEAAKKQGT